MRLFARCICLNECINIVATADFRDTHFTRDSQCGGRWWLTRYLRDGCFRQILLVAGEHPKFVSGDYLAECVRALAPDFPSIAIEVGPMAAVITFPSFRAGAEGLVVYQETYQRSVYAELHTAGPSAI